MIEAVKSESTPNVSHDPGLTNYEEQGVTYVKGLSLSMNDMNRDNSGYHPLCLQSDASLPEHSTSGTEASSFGSTYSSGKLLLDNAESTDWEIGGRVYVVSIQSFNGRKD